MVTMNISLPATLKSYVDEQVDRLDYPSSSEYVRDLIRRDQERHRFRQLLHDGGASPVAGLADDEYFASLRTRARERTGG